MAKKKKRAHPSAPRSPVSSQMSLEKLFTPDLLQKSVEDSREKQEAYVQEARDVFFKKGIVLYLGAGVSSDVNLPTWWQLIDSLTVTMVTDEVDSIAKTMSSMNDHKRAEVTLQLQREVSRESTTKPILMMARAIKQKLGHKVPYRVAEAIYRPLLLPDGVANKPHSLERLFRKLDVDDTLAAYDAITNSKLFKAIVEICRAQRDVVGVQAIVNFNYDDLIEEWLRENNVRCDTITTGGEDQKRDSSVPCFHVHGVLPFRRINELRERTQPQAGVSNSDESSAYAYLRDIVGNFVFSEDEYHREYSDAYRWSNMTMLNQLSQNGGLFIGLSLQDPNLRRLLDAAHKQYPDIKHYAILTRREPDTGGTHDKTAILRRVYEQVEMDAFEDIGIRVIWTNDYKEVPPLIHRICKID